MPVVRQADHSKHVPPELCARRPPASAVDQFHPDTDGNTADGDVTRFTRRPYGVPNFVSTFYYLTDVDETTPLSVSLPPSLAENVTMCFFNHPNCGQRFRQIRISPDPNFARGATN